MNIIINNLDEMKKFAENLSKFIKKTDVICLEGDLGAGKTTFTSFLINSLLKEKIDVLSPTFNIVQTYDIDGMDIHHYDLYRLEDINEIFEIGIEDNFEEGICIIEWPEIINEILPKDRLLISIGLDQQQIRNVHIKKFGNWNQRITSKLV